MSLWDYFGRVTALTGETILVWAPGLRLPTLPGDYFGNSVALADNLAVIGADYQDESRGGVYSFAWDGSGWQMQEQLAIAEPAPYDLFGGVLATANGYVIASAQGDDALVLNSGAAYLFPVTTISFKVDRELVSQGAPVGTRPFLLKTIAIFWRC